MAKRPLGPLVALALVLAAAGARADDPAARARGILADPSYQGERPGAPAALPCSGLPGGCAGDKKGAQPGGTRAGDTPGKSGAGSGGSGDTRRGEGTSGQEKPGESSGGHPGGERDGEPSGKSGSGSTDSGDTRRGEGPSGQQKTESSGGRQDGERDEQPSTEGRGKETRRPSDLPPPPREAPSRSAAGEVIGTLLLAVVGAGVAVLLVFGIAVALRRRERGEPETMVAAVAGAPAAPAEMSDAEKLAQEGRYADAVHLLLQSALAHVAARGGLSIDEAMTSREVLADAALDDASRRALRELVVSVELSLFGGADVTREGYARCVESYRRIAPAGGA